MRGDLRCYAAKERISAESILIVWQGALVGRTVRGERGKELHECCLR